MEVVLPFIFYYLFITIFYFLQNCLAPCCCARCVFFTDATSDPAWPRAGPWVGLGVPFLGVQVRCE